MVIDRKRLAGACFEAGRGEGTDVIEGSLGEERYFSIHSLLGFIEKK